MTLHVPQETHIAQGGGGASAPKECPTSRFSGENVQVSCMAWEGPDQGADSPKVCRASPSPLSTTTPGNDSEGIFGRKVKGCYVCVGNCL